MARTYTTEGLTYIRSEDVKVFPCAYRGYISNGVDNGTNKVFDPEARAFTEFNYSNIFSKPSENKKSFIISWDTIATNTSGQETTSIQVLKCVIGGYYFEIKNISPADFEDLENDEDKVLGIKLKEIPLGTQPPYSTYVLDTFLSTTVNYLDTTFNQNYYFTGLVIIPANSNAPTNFRLAPTRDGAINWNVKRLADVITTDAGVCSLKMCGDTDSAGLSTNACTATGDFAVALGSTNTASHNYATALGNNNIASNISALATGSSTTASHINSATFGDHTATSANNQVVIGQYNRPVSDTLFIIGNGGENTPTNAFVVDTGGTTSITGNLYVNGGDIFIANKTNNKLEIGSKTTNNKSGHLTIYGTTKNAVFEVEKTGDTTIAGEVEISKDTTIKKNLEVNGAITSQGGATGDHTLILGSKAENDYGAIIVHGASSSNNDEDTEINTEVFTVSNTGAVAIADTLEVTNATNLYSTLDVTGPVTFTDQTDIENIDAIETDAALDISGGVLIGKKLRVGNDAKIVGNTTISGKTIITNDTDINEDVNDAALKVNGGTIIGQQLNVGDNTTIGGILNITDNTDSTATTNGALVVSGGAGIGRDLFIGGSITCAGTTMLDGISISKDTFSIGPDWTGQESSTHDNTDALVINAGVHTNGKLSSINGLFIGNSTDGEVARISGGGHGWFKQELTVGPDQKGGQAGDNVFFRVGKSNLEGSVPFATLKGTLTVTQGATIANGLNVTGMVTAGDPNSAGTAMILHGNLNMDGYTLTATTFKATSDLRKKTNIKDFKYKKSILDLPIKNFEFINDEAHTKHIGCIAQDLQQLYPELVHEDKDGYLSIEETKLVYLLLEEVKELKKELNNLKGE